MVREFHTFTELYIYMLLLSQSDPAADSLQTPRDAPFILIAVFVQEERLQLQGMNSKSVGLTFRVREQEKTRIWESQNPRITRSGTHTIQESDNLGITIWDSHNPGLTRSGTQTLQESSNSVLALSRLYTIRELHDLRNRQSRKHTIQESGSSGRNYSQKSRDLES